MGGGEEESLRGGEVAGSGAAVSGTFCYNEHKKCRQEAEMICLQVIALVVAILSFLMMIWLHYRTSNFQKSMAKSTRDNLEFIVNLVINAAADPRTLRRLIDDYAKNKEWRGGVFRGEDCKYHIAYEMPSRETIKIGDIEITVIKFEWLCGR